jgi:hypothetical protein
MKKILFFSSVICLVFSCFVGSAQLPDGVTVTNSYLSEIKKNYTDETRFGFDLDAFHATTRISMDVHIVKNMLGMPGVKASDIEYSVNIANGYFVNIGIQFFIGSIDYISDYHYNNIADTKTKTELLTKYYIPGRINIFLVDSITIGTSRKYGFTYFPDAVDSNFVFLDKNYASGNSLTTLMGHFMGLLSTHETGGGIEAADEHNCSTSGDYICDTYADPDLFNQVVEPCNYTGSMKDTDGRFYVPSVANIMSNTSDNCKCIFTPLQYKRMYYYYIKYRQYLK